MKRLVDIMGRGSFVLPFFLFFLIFYLPLIFIFSHAFFSSEGGISLVNIFNILTNPYYLRIIGFTFYQALLSTVFAVILGLPGAYLISHYDFRLKAFIKSVAMIPFILPSILVVLGFVLLYGNNGILNRFLVDHFGFTEGPVKLLYSFKAIIFAHVFYNFPICLRFVSVFWEKLPLNRIEAAKSLGASRFDLLRTIFIPGIMPGIVSSASLIFLYCFMSFAVVLILGGGPQYATLEVEVYKLTKISLDFSSGSALALIGTLVSLGLLNLYIKYEKKTAVVNKIEATILRKKLFGNESSLFLKSFAVFYFALVLFLITAPLVSIAVFSLKEQAGRSGNVFWSLRWYREMFFSGKNSPYYSILFSSVKNSLVYALSTVFISCSFASVFSWILTRKKVMFSSFWESFLMMPLGVSSVILGFSYLYFQNNYVLSRLNNSFLIIVAHSVIALPFVFKSIISVQRNISGNLIAASRSLGAGSFRTFFDIELPVIKNGLISAAIFAFAISSGEMNSTLMLADKGQRTIPLAIYELISSYRFYAACALGTILMVLCFSAFILIDRMNKGNSNVS